jgi:hypothetical protein
MFIRSFVCFFSSRIIFEQNQADLEHATEELSGYLERDFSQTNGSLTEMKQKVQDKYRYCSTRRKVLLDHVTEGYECDYWFVFLSFLFHHIHFFLFF